MARIFENLRLDDWKQDDIKCFELLNKPLTRKRKGVLVSVTNDTLLDEVVDNLLKESVELTGVNLNMKPDRLKQAVKVDSEKRKLRPSPEAGKVEQVLKFRRGPETDGGSSPALRIRTGLDTKIKSPPAGGDLTSPAFGRIKKTKRRLTTPKRSFTPDKRQILITSVFSPKVTRNQEKEN